MWGLMLGLRDYVWLGARGFLDHDKQSFVRGYPEGSGGSTGYDGDLARHKNPTVKNNPGLSRHIATLRSSGSRLKERKFRQGL